MLHETAFGDVNLASLTAFDKDWMALTAGNRENGFNSMTVSWGHIGTIWNRPSVVCYVRPQRYTKSFMDREELFTLSYFGGEQRKALNILGTKSGRDCDKIAEAGLTPFFTDGTTCFEEAKLVFVCRKLFQTTMTDEMFKDKAVLEQIYPTRDLHDIYIGQIIRVLKND